MLCSLNCTLEWLGAATLAFFLFRAATFVYRYYVANTNVRTRYAKAGTWAVVTGASDGIGRALTLEFAQRGMNVALIARNQTKMDAVVADVTKLNVQAKTFVFDFATATSDGYATLFKQLSAIEIAVLVNNVGVNYEHGAPFDSVPVEEDLRLVKVNCDAMVQMTKFVIPIFKQKRCGAIINLSSVAALHSSPYMSTYAATKAFNKLFSDSLRVELREFNIDVMTVTPNLVISNMTQGVSTRRPKRNFVFVDAESMASDTIRQIGVADCTTGHRNHQILEGVFFFFPNMVWNTLLLSMQKKVYRSVLAKKSKTAGAGKTSS